jgi:hypothetical protein
LVFANPCQPPAPAGEQRSGYRAELRRYLRDGPRGVLRFES